MYVIECITKDSPYISIGYWGAFHLVRGLSNAMTFNKENEVKMICQRIRSEYDGKKHVALMPWVYGITKDGKLGKRFMDLEH